MCLGCLERDFGLYPSIFRRSLWWMPECQWEVSMVERAEISQVLAQMRQMQAQMQRGVQEASPMRIDAQQFVQPQQPVAGFGELFSKAIDGVNATQKQANDLREGYEVGAPGVSLTQVMVAAEKSSVAFDAMVQVRNKLVESYKEIMSMPV
jgi:flagellar hook-basal body complex protein FliE